MDANAPELDWLVSVDDHVIEPPNVWVDRLPGQVPRRRARGCWSTTRGSTTDKRVGRRRACRSRSASARRSSRRTRCRTRRCAQAAYDPIARVVDMDRAGILGSLCFPSFPRFCGQMFWEAKDKDLALLCVQAYNDWMIDEWCGAAPGRYIPLIIIPLWDPPPRPSEIERCAAQGRDRVRVLGEPRAARPAHDPRPGPLLGSGAGRGAGHRRSVVCMHVGSSSTMPEISTDAPVLANLTFGAVRAAGTMLAWLFSGILRADARAEDRAVRGQDRLDAVLPRAGRAGHRQAAALGEEHQHRVLQATRSRPEQVMADLDHLDVRGDDPRPHLRLLHRGDARACGRSTSSARTT